MATLQNESTIIQKDINKINDLIGNVKELSHNENPDMLSFLIRYKQLAETIEACLAKPIRRKINDKVS